MVSKWSNCQYLRSFYFNKYFKKFKKKLQNSYFSQYYSKRSKFCTEHYSDIDLPKSYLY